MTDRLSIQEVPPSPDPFSTINALGGHFKDNNGLFEGDGAKWS